MAADLYDAAFSTLGRLLGDHARASMTGLTLLGGFASTLGWPLIAGLEHQIGWRYAERISRKNDAAVPVQDGVL